VTNAKLTANTDRKTGKEKITARQKRQEAFASCLNLKKSYTNPRER
jgi:hypothetical protein